MLTDLSQLSNPLTMQEEAPEGNLTLREDLNNSNPVQGEVARNRAAKMHLAMGKNSPGEDAITNMLVTGQEGDLRNYASKMSEIDQHQRNVAYAAKLTAMGKPQEAMTLVDRLRQPALVDPKTVMEEGFADHYVKSVLNNSSATGPESVVHTALAENPEEAQKQVNGTARIIARQHVAAKNYEDMAEKIKKQGTLSYIWDIAETMVPLASAIRKSPDWSISNIALPGSSMAEERDKFWAFDNIGDAAEWLEKRTTEIAKSNPLDALEFAKHIKEMSTEDKFVSNVFGAADTQFIGSVAGGIGKAAITGLGLKRLLRSSVTGTFDEKGMFKPEAALAAVGDTKAAVNTKIVSDLLKGKDPFNATEEIFNDVFSIAHPASIINLDPGSLTKSRADRMKTALKGNSADLVEAILTGTRAQRVTEEALVPMLKNAENSIRAQFPSVNDSIADMRVRWNEALNVNFGEAIILKRDGSAFKSATQAERYAFEEMKLDPHEFKLVRGELPEAILAKQTTEPATVGFTTAKGSTYKLHDDGTTTRTKKILDKGVKEQSSKTIYMTPEEARTIAPTEGTWRYAEKDGKISLITRTEDRPWGKVPGQDIAYKTKPAEGLVPVEFWGKPKTLMGHETYSKVHFGHEITALRKEGDNLRAGGLLNGKTPAQVRTSLEGDKKRLAAMQKSISTPEAKAAEVVSVEHNFKDNLAETAPMDSRHKGGEVRRYTFKTGGEEIEVVVDASKNGKILNIDSFYGAKSDLGEKVSIKASGVKEILAALRKEYPEAQLIEGNRVSGARAAKGLEDHFPALTIGANASMRLPQQITPKMMESIKKNAEALGKTIADKEAFLEKGSTAAREKMDKLLTLHQLGDYWYISITKPLDETAPNARAMLMTTKNTNPVNMGEGLLSMIKIGTNIDKIRSAEDILSTFQRNNRHLATHAPQEVQRLMAEKAMLIGKLDKQSLQDLERVLINNRDYIDKTLPPNQQRGRAYRTQAQLEREWMTINNGRLPSDQASLGYWTYHQMMDIDWVVRNFAAGRDLLRQGAEQFTVKVGDKGVTFPGKFTPDVPWEHSEDFGILVISKDGTSKFHYRKDLERKELMEYKTALEEGTLKAIQIGNPADRVFAEVTGKGRTAHFVFTPEFKSKALPLNLVDYNPGVHIQYPQEHYIKQTSVERDEKGRLRDFGDKTIMSAETEATAKKHAASLTTVQTMIRNKATDAELNAFIHKNLPEDAEFWREKFKSFLDMDQPIGHVYSGKSFYDDMRPDLKPKDMISERNSSFNMFRSINVDFMADRNQPLQNIINKGTLEKPIYSMENARVLDPFAVMNRSMNNAIRTLHMNDYKIGAIEQWVQQFAHTLEGNLNSHLENPFQAFYQGRFNNQFANRAELDAAINSKTRINNFLGTKSEFGKDLDWVNTKLMNSMGDGKAKWYNDHELKFLKDPIGFTRAFMFHTIFGLFNPKQYLVQAQGFAHVLGVAGPDAAMRGLSAYVIQRAAHLTTDEATLNRLANIATNFGWSNKEHFLESYRLMRENGVSIIGREHALREGSFDPSLFKDKFSTFLSWGATPFSEGEKVVRIAAWNTAYYEFRKANPTKEIGRYETGDILRRADDLWLNMTRASSSALQEGFVALPTQFYTFSQRIMEQFWGSRLTQTEKLRAFATHAALYGVPVAAGAMIPWPFYDSLRKDLLAKGSPWLQEDWHKIATEGFLSYVAGMTLGREYNIEQRYGPDFKDKLSKLLEGDTSFAETVFGATGTFVNSIFTSAYPLKAQLYTMMYGKDEEYPLTKEDLMGAIRVVSSFNDIHNAIAMINTGKYMSKQGTWVAGSEQKPMDWMDAAAVMMGLNRKEISDTRLMMGVQKDQEAYQKKVQAHVLTELTRAFTYLGQKDGVNADVHFGRATALMRAVGDFDHKMIRETLERAENAPLVDRIRKQFTEHGYQGQLPARLRKLFENK